VVGDTLKDIEAGNRVGARGVLVRTGYGAESAAQLESREEPLGGMKGSAAGSDEKTRIVEPVHIAGDILAAVRWLLKDREK